MLRWAALAALVAAGGASGGAGSGRGACGVAEFSCGDGRCVPLERYCDARPHCADGSDEPPRCSVCNRTYYGRAGATYELGLERPRTPFLCHLTLTAAGGDHGDLVQLAFDEFAVGRYEAGAGAGDGCPDGHMQLAELGRPFAGGAWCGAAAGYAAYFSETPTVTVSLRLVRDRPGAEFRFRMRYKFLPRRDAVVRFGPAAAPLQRGAVSPGTYCTRTFDECHRAPCRLQSPNYPGVYPRNVTCYWSVRQRAVPACKHALIQVRQDAPHKVRMRRALAPAGVNKTGRAVRAWAACSGDRDRLIFYDGASTDDAVLLEYCGGDWLPPVLSRGPDMLVAFHSSPLGAPLLAAPPSPSVAAPPSPLRGFELDVDVVFVDSDSLEYAREPRRCEFHVKAASPDEERNVTDAGRGRRGVIRAPAHTLPPGAACTWTLHGRPGDLVWLYFSSYEHRELTERRRKEPQERVAGDKGGATGKDPGGGETRGGENRGEDGSPWARLRDLLRGRPAPATVSPGPPPEDDSCPTELRVWEGEDRQLGRYCGAPPVCARAALANATRAPRACTRTESYVSSGARIAVSVRTDRGTATHPLRFSLHYEFVDARLGGAPLELGGGRAEPAECARLFETAGEVRSPRNVLWFGRGGARRLRCVYRLQAGRHDRVELRVLETGLIASGAGGACHTRLHAHTGRPVCARAGGGELSDLDWEEEPLEWGSEWGGAGVAVLRVYEAPWAGGRRVLVACMCGGGVGAEGEQDETRPLTVTSGSSALEVEFAAWRLTPRDDQRRLHFSLTWQPTPSPAPSHTSCSQRRRLAPPGGHVHLVFPYEFTEESSCGTTPYLLEARDGRSVFLRVWGRELSPGGGAVGEGTAAGADGGGGDICHTDNRVLVYGGAARLLRAVCPGEVGGPAVHVFSEGWQRGGGSAGGAGDALLVVWWGRMGGEAAFSWMEVWPGPSDNDTRARGDYACCPELNACGAAVLRCDGAADCPEGGDELEPQCGSAQRVLAALGGARAAGGAGGALLAAVLLAAASVAMARRRRARAAAAPAPRKLTAHRRTLTSELLFGSRSSAGS